MSYAIIAVRDQYKGKAGTEFSEKSKLYMRRLPEILTSEKLDHPSFYHAEKRLNQTLAFRLFADIW